MNIQYSTVLEYSISHTPINQNPHAYTSLHSCTHAPIHPYTHTPMRLYTHTLIHSCTYIPIHPHTHAPMHPQHSNTVTHTVRDSVRMQPPIDCDNPSTADNTTAYSTHTNTPCYPFFFYEIKSNESAINIKKLFAGSYINALIFFNLQ